MNLLGNLNGRGCCWLPGILSVLALGGRGASATINVVVQTVQHDQLTARLVRFDLDGELILELPDTAQPLSVPASDVVSIRSIKPTAPAPGPHCLLLEGGDRLYGTLSGGTADQVVLDTFLRKGLSIPLERLRACLTEQARLPGREAALQALLRDDAPDDRVLMSNGDLVTGLVVRFGPDFLTFEHQDQEIQISFDVVVAVAMAAVGPTAASAPRARVDFADGSAITVSRVRWSSATLDMTYFDGTIQDLPGQAVQQLEVLGGRWRWLDAQQPEAYHHTPLLSLKWPYRLNRSVTGGPLRIAGRQFKHGIGVHSRTVLTYALDGEFRRFSAWCGLDDTAGPLADVSAAVIVDGECKWQQRHMKSGEAPQRVQIDLDGGRRLELRVDFGDNGDLQDRFNWGDAALVR